MTPDSELRWSCWFTTEESPRFPIYGIIWLGRFGEYDLWFDYNHMEGVQQVMARYELGASWVDIEKFDKARVTPQVREAYRRAVVLGLIDRPDKAKP